MSTRSSAVPQARGTAVNPAPRERYRITMTLADAPGPFASMRALAQYDVANRECLSPPADNPGGRSAPMPTEDVEIPLTRVGDDAYEGVVYADYLLDTDYAGRGACHWKLMQFRVHMKATGAAQETLFIPSLPDVLLLEGKGRTVYFVRDDYPAVASVPGYPATGVDDRARFAPSLKDSDLFTVSFTARKDPVP